MVSWMTHLPVDIALHGVVGALLISTVKASGSPEKSAGFDNQNEVNALNSDLGYLREWNGTGP